MSSPRSDNRSKVRRHWIILVGTLIVLTILLLWTPPGRSLWANPDTSRSAHATAPSKVPRPNDRPTTPRSSNAFRTRVWSVPADFLLHLQDNNEVPGGLDPFATTFIEHPSLIDYREAKQALENRGVPFPLGSRARFDATVGQLNVHNTPANLQLIDEIITGPGPMPMWTIDPKLFQTNDPPPDPGIGINEDKLKLIIIPVVEFEDITFGEAIEFLEQRAKELDPEGLGVRLHIVEPQLDNDQEQGTDQEEGLGAWSIQDAYIRELRLRNVPLATVLQYMMDSTGIRYRIDPDRVSILTMTSGPAPRPQTREWHVDPALMKRLRFPPFKETRRLVPDPFASDSLEHTRQASNKEEWQAKRSEMSVTDLLKDEGISFPPGTEAHYSAETATFTITGRYDDLDRAESLFMALAADESKARAGF